MKLCVGRSPSYKKARIKNPQMHLSIHVLMFSPPSFFFHPSPFSLVSSFYFETGYHNAPVALKLNPPTSTFKRWDCRHLPPCLAQDNILHHMQSCARHCYHGGNLATNTTEIPSILEAMFRQERCVAHTNKRWHLLPFLPSCSHPPHPFYSFQVSFSCYPSPLFPFFFPHSFPFSLPHLLCFHYVSFHSFSKVED